MCVVCALYIIVIAYITYAFNSYYMYSYELYLKWMNELFSLFTEKKIIKIKMYI